MDRGVLRLQRKDANGARADFEAITAIAPHDATFELAIAQAYESAGDFDEAINRFDSWIAAHPKDDRIPEAHARRCWSRVVLDRGLDLALADCNAALKSTPSSAFLNSRALVWLRLAKFDNSIADFRASLRLQPKGAWALYGLGLAEKKHGMQAQGDKDIAAAIALTPTIAKEFQSLNLAP